MKFKRKCFVAILILSIAALLSSSCRRGGDGARIDREFYMNCTECGARYSVASDHLATLDFSQSVLLDTGETLFECRECGKIAARYEIVTLIDGELEHDEN